MRSIRTFIDTVMAVIVVCLVASLTFPALAEDVASAFDAPTEMACPLVTSPVQSADVLAVSEVHRMSPVPGAEYSLDLVATLNTHNALPFGGTAGHSTALGIRPEQT